MEICMWGSLAGGVRMTCEVQGPSRLHPRGTGAMAAAPERCGVAVQCASGQCASGQCKWPVQAASASG